MIARDVSFVLDVGTVEMESPPKAAAHRRCAEIASAPCGSRTAEWIDRRRSRLHTAGRLTNGSNARAPLPQGAMSLHAAAVGGWRAPPPRSGSTAACYGPLRSPVVC